MSEIISEEILRVRNKNLYYLHTRIDVERDTVLFFHGFPDNAHSWKKQIKLFSKEFNVFAPFLPGAHVNDQTSDLGRAFIKSYTTRVLEMLDKHGVDRDKKIYIVGHDLGGVFAEELLEQLADQVAGIIFVNSMSFNIFIRNLLGLQIVKSWYMPLLQVPGVKNIFLSQKEKVKKFIDFYSKRNILGEEQQGNLASVHLYTRILQEKIKDIKLSTTKIGVQSLFIFNKQDPFIEIPKKSLLEKFYDNPRVRVLNGGHWSYFDNVPQIYKEIRDFIEEHKNKWDS